MNRHSSHIYLLTLLAGLFLLVASRGPLADEPDDAADEVASALTERPGTAPAGSAESAGAIEAPAAAAASPVPEAAATGTGTADTDDAEAVAGEAVPAHTVAPQQAVAAEDDAVEPELPADPGAAAPDGVAAGDPAPEKGLESQVADTLPREHDVEDSGVVIDTLTDDPVESGRAVPLADAVSIADEATARTLTLLKTDVLPGTYQRLSWSATEMFEDLPVSTPVLVVNGKAAGPILCLTAAVHGDELNGIEMVRRVMHDLNPQKLSGAVIGVPIVNLQGFRRGSRYLPDRRDLNRYFPGNPRGSAASRIAHSFFTEVIEHCDALIDLHTGSFDRANLPQLRADLRNPDVVTLTHGFGATVILHSEPAEGTLRHAATYAGIPSVTLEAGGPSELELKEVMHGVKGVETLLNTLGMVDKIRLWGDQQPVYYRSSWVRANRGGILLADVSLGSTVRRGDLLGTITDPMNNASTNLYSPYSGRVIGMARNQVVMPGFAAFHVGIQAVDASAVDNGSRDSRDPDSREQRADEALAHESETNSDDYVDGMSE